MGNEWQSGIFGCFSDWRMCCLTFCVPCYTLGKNAEHLGEDCLVYGLLAAIGVNSGPVVRWRLRQEKDLPGSMLTDVLLYIVLPCCALMQEAKEIGWALPEGVVKAGDKVESARNKNKKTEEGGDQAQDMTRE